MSIRNGADVTRRHRARVICLMRTNSRVTNRNCTTRRNRMVCSVRSVRGRIRSRHICIMVIVIICVIRTIRTRHRRANHLSVRINDMVTHIHVFVT